MILNIIEASNLSYTEINEMDVHEFFINYMLLVKKAQEQRLKNAGK